MVRMLNDHPRFPVDPAAPASRAECGRAWAGAAVGGYASGTNAPDAAGQARHGRPAPGTAGYAGMVPPNVGSGNGDALQARSPAGNFAGKRPAGTRGPQL